MKKPYWKNTQYWICPEHLPSVRIPSNIAACWFSGCKSLRPVMMSEPPSIRSARDLPPPKRVRRPPAGKEKRVASKSSKSTDPTAPTSQSLCSWTECEKGESGGPAFARKRSKYCSRDCSNRNARANYLKRKS